MSFQAYLDNIEEKITKNSTRVYRRGKSKRFLITPKPKQLRFLTWLKEEYDLGRGHGMALVHIIKNSPQIADNHVGSGGTHNDPSNTLILTGKN